MLLPVLLLLILILVYCQNDYQQQNNLPGQLHQNNQQNNQQYQTGQFQQNNQQYQTGQFQQNNQQNNQQYQTGQFQQNNQQYQTGQFQQNNQPPLQQQNFQHHQGIPPDIGHHTPIINSQKNLEHGIPPDTPGGSHIHRSEHIDHTIPFVGQPPQHLEKEHQEFLKFQEQKRMEAQQRTMKHMPEQRNNHNQAQKMAQQHLFNKNRHKKMQYDSKWGDIKKKIIENELSNDAISNDDKKNNENSNENFNGNSNENSNENKNVDGITKSNPFNAIKDMLAHTLTTHQHKHKSIAHDNQNVVFVSALSFSPPFNEATYDGNRIIGSSSAYDRYHIDSQYNNNEEKNNENDNSMMMDYYHYYHDYNYYYTSGTYSAHEDAKIHSSFIRLTPDRQNKRGTIWSNYNINRALVSSGLGLILNSNDISNNSAIHIEFSFRISGQGSNLFGDGIAFILANDRYQSGSFFGVDEMFTGVAVIFDTFRNAEHPFHKDIVVVINNGSYSVADMMLKASTTFKADTNSACDASFRYHEKRDDFHVLNKSTVRMKILNNILTLEIDPSSTGVFKKCLTRKLDELPDDFIKGAYIGITSSTGHLADNHDVISVKVFIVFHNNLIYIVLLLLIDLS